MRQLQVGQHAAPTPGLDALGPFLEWARVARERGPAANARCDARPVVGIFCSFVPAEIPLACGATPVRLCAGDPRISADADSALGRDACPVVKSALSWLERAQPDGRPDIAIVPASCDWKAKLSAALGDRLPVLELNVPHRRDVDAFARELRDLTARLGDLTDFTATRRTLGDAVATVAHAEAELRALHVLRRAHPPLLRGSEAMLVAQTLGLVHPDAWTQAVRDLTAPAHTRRAGAGPASAPASRLLLTGSPVLWPNLKVPQLVEQADGDIVAEDFCSRMAVLYEDRPPPERDLMQYLARRQTSPCACGSSGPERLALVARLVHDFAVTGIIIHALKGCAPVAMDVAATRRLAAERGLPVLEIETDYGREDIEPLRTRLETFVHVTRS